MNGCKNKTPQGYAITITGTIKYLIIIMVSYTFYMCLRYIEGELQHFNEISSMLCPNIRKQAF